MRQSLDAPLLALLLMALPPGSAVAQASHDQPTWENTYEETYSEETSFEDEAYEEEYVRTDLDRIDAAHAGYLGDTELQLERPEQDFAIPEPDPPPRWLAAIFEFLEALGPLFKILFWAAVALVVAGLLYFIFGEAIRMRFGGKQKIKVKATDDVFVDLRPDAAAARSLLEEADALASRGQFEEAVRLLLFRSIEDIQQRLEGGVPNSLTAREIAGLGKLPERARRALAPIIQVVERSFFGGRPVNAESWQDARRSYEDFAFGAGWT